MASKCSSNTNTVSNIPRAYIVSSIGMVNILMFRFSVLLYHTTSFSIKLPVSTPLTIKKGISVIKKLGKNLPRIFGFLLYTSPSKIIATLVSVGYDLVKITEGTPELWEVVDAVLVGIRAFNTEPWLMESKDRITAYVEGGGNFVVTYTTAGRGGMELPLPVPLTIGRDRVTEEYAPVSIGSHSLTMEPNELISADFEQWVQERGLYFPVVNESFTTVFSIEESTGIIYPNSTVVANYGKGSVIYTVLSLFRELPSLVPVVLRILQYILHYDH